MGARDHDLRHGRRLRRRAQRDLDRRMARDEGRGRPGSDRDRDEDLQPDGGGRRPRSRAARIRRQIETSLRRLGVERVALYLAHAFDPETPQEETLEAFGELVRSGQGRRGRRLELLRRAARRGARAGRAGRACRATSGCRTASPSSTRATASRVFRSLPRARPRLHALQPARGRLADGQVPARGAAAGRLAHDAAPGAVHGLHVRRASSTLSRRSSATPGSAASRWRRWRSPGRSPSPS